MVGIGFYIGDEISYPVMFRDYFINHEIRIPSLSNQDDSWKVVGVFFVKFASSLIPQENTKWH